MPSLPLSLRPYHQIPQQDPGDPGGQAQGDGLDQSYQTATATAIPDKPVSRWASLRIYWLAAVLCCGGALFGYDSGVIGVSTLTATVQRQMNEKN